MISIHLDDTILEPPLDIPLRTTFLPYTPLKSISITYYFTEKFPQRINPLHTQDNIGICQINHIEIINQSVVS